MAALFNTFTEPFTGSSLPGTFTSFTGGSATLSWSGLGGQTNFPATTSSSTDGDITTISQYNLTGNRIFINVRQVATGSTSTDCTFSLLASGSTANTLAWQWEAGLFYAEQNVASVRTNLGHVTYNATTHAWWSIRETAGTTYWETSPDGVNWVVQFSTANPVTLTSMNCNIAGTSFGVDTNNPAFIFRSFNTGTRKGSGTIQAPVDAGGMSAGVASN